MEQIAKLASKLGNVAAIWIENRPDLVEGYINSIRRYSNHSIDLHVATNHSKAEELADDLTPSGYVLDIKLSGDVDGITIAKRIRQRNRVIPIEFVTSYKNEYQRRLKEVDNVGGVYDRLSLKDELFDGFKKTLTEQLFSYRIYTHFDLENMTWLAFVKHPHREEIARAHSYLFSRMARTVMLNRSWNWVVICGDKSVTGGKSLSRFPSFEDKKELARKHGAVPFVYSRPIISEEGGSLGALLDQYPKAIIGINGRQVLANIDTGTNQTMISDHVTDPEPGSVPEKGVHLGKRFEYYINKRSVTLQSVKNGKQSVGPIMMPVAIIDDWKTSPWIKINPRRGALVGRDIFAVESLSLQITSSAGRRGVSTTITRVKNMKPAKKRRVRRKPGQKTRL